MRGQERQAENSCPLPITHFPVLITDEGEGEKYGFDHDIHGIDVAIAPGSFRVTAVGRD